MSNNINEKTLNKSKKSTRPIVLLGVCSISFMLLVSLGTFLFFRVRVGNAADALMRGNSTEYDMYFALICDDTPFWEQVHNAASESALDKNVYVDMISKRLGEEYSKEDLLAIAIEADVDGILLEGEDTDSMRKLISEADSRGICVVTLGTDCNDSKRKSFIQGGSYNLGKIYGEQVLSKMTDMGKNILVVMDGSNKGTSQNIVFSGIQDTINSKNKEKSTSITALAVDSSDSFATEEDIRSIFMDNKSLPDIVICLNEQSTSSVYQALVDYNQVGNVRLIGYYNTDNILNGIKQGVIEATVSVDTEELGEYAVEAASEFLDTGYVSEYFSVDLELISSDNINEYIAGEGQGE